MKSWWWMAGSSDATIRIAVEHGARVIHESRRGYGQACHSGLLAASGELVVFLDADGADDPTHLPQLITPLVSGQSDLVLGSRLAGKMDKGAMPCTQWAGNVLAAAMFRWFYGLQITDLSPFRAAPSQKLLGLELVEMTYGYPTEMIARAARRRWNILEIPVSYHRRRVVNAKSPEPGGEPCWLPSIS